MVIYSWLSDWCTLWYSMVCCLSDQWIRWYSMVNCLSDWCTVWYAMVNCLSDWCNVWWSMVNCQTGVLYGILWLTVCQRLVYCMVTVCQTHYCVVVFDFISVRLKPGQKTKKCSLVAILVICQLRNFKLGVNILVCCMLAYRLTLCQTHFCCSRYNVIWLFFNPQFQPVPITTK